MVPLLCLVLIFHVPVRSHFLSLQQQVWLRPIDNRGYKWPQAYHHQWRPSTEACHTPAQQIPLLQADLARMTVRISARHESQLHSPSTSYLKSAKKPSTRYESDLHPTRFPVLRISKQLLRPWNPSTNSQKLRIFQKFPTRIERVFWRGTLQFISWWGFSEHSFSGCLVGVSSWSNPCLTGHLLCTTDVAKGCSRDWILCLDEPHWLDWLQQSLLPPCRPWSSPPGHKLRQD